MTSVFFLDASTTRRGGALLQSTPRRAFFALVTALALLALGRRRAAGHRPVEPARPIRPAPQEHVTATPAVHREAAATPQPAASSTTSVASTVRSPGWAAVVTASLCRALLAVIATLTVLAVAPAAWGWESSVIRSGSMAPAVRVGDVLVVRPATPQQLVPGQVLVVEDPDQAGQLRAHRLVSVRPDGFLELKGDANQAADSTPVDPENLRGVGVLNVPKVGMIDVWLSTQDWEKLAACLLGVLLLEAGRRRDKPRKPKAPTRSRAPRLVLVGPARAVALSVLVLLATTGSDNEAYAKFTGKTLNATSQIGANATFYPYRDAVLSDSPIRYWRLSEASGAVATDASTLNLPGTYFGSYVRGQPSPLTWEPAQRSVSFTAGAITANLSETAPSAFSLEAFIKTGTAGGRIIGFGNGSGGTASTQTDRHLYMSSAGNIVLGVGTTTKYTAVTPGSYNDNAWHHVVGTYTQAGGLRIYVDGTLRVTTSSTPTASPNYTGYWRAGGESLSGWAPAGSAYFVGQLDELAVYSTALSAAQVTAHYTAATLP